VTDFSVVIYRGFSVLFRTMFWQLQQFKKKKLMQFLLSEFCSLFSSWSICCNETFTNSISRVIDRICSLFSSAPEVQYVLQPASSKVIKYTLTHLFTSFTNFNVRLKSTYLFYWMFLQLIYLHSATEGLVCVLYLYYLKSPISLRAVSRYLCLKVWNLQAS